MEKWINLKQYQVYGWFKLNFMWCCRGCARSGRVVVVDSWRTAQRVLTLSDCLRLAYFDFNDIAHELRIRFLCNIMSIPLFLVEEFELGLFLSANQISMDHKNLWCCHQRIRPRFANKFHWTLIRSCKTQHKTHSKCLKNITSVAFKESKN